MHYPQITYVML